MSKATNLTASSRLGLVAEDAFEVRLAVAKGDELAVQYEPRGEGPEIGETRVSLGELDPVSAQETEPLVLHHCGRADAVPLELEEMGRGIEGLARHGQHGGHEVAEAP